MDPADFIWFNDRLQPAEESAGSGHPNFTIPPNRILVVTDIVIQNRSPGDSPVGDTDFSRLFITGDGTIGGGADYAVTVVGNRTLSLHFQTGVRVKNSFRVLNAPNSSAPFVEYLVSGYLADKPAGL
jgi:hypothetical protein